MTADKNLRDAQRKSGAIFAGSAGDGPPLHFGSPADEYASATSGAALIDFTDRPTIELTGADRVAFLHNFCTNDIKRLLVGQGCEAFVTNVKGRVVGHVWVDVTQTSLWLDLFPTSTERLLAHLERYIINEDVQIADRSGDYGAFLVVGPRAVDRLASLGIDVSSLANLGHIECDLWGWPARVRRFDVGADRGYVVVAPRERLAELWPRLCEAGFRPAGAEVWNALRIESGFPIYGVDITDDNLAQEVSRTRENISFTKGCYLGQEPIARIDAMGHVNRELRSLRLAAGSVPNPGANVFSETAAPQAQAVGTITSAAFSYASNSPVALAVLRSNVIAVGNQVVVETPDGPAAATVFWQPVRSSNV